MTAVLTVTAHDRDGRLAELTSAWMPALRELFPAVAVQATDVSHPATLEACREAGALVRTERHAGLIGRDRRLSVELGLTLSDGHLFVGELDRMLHWVEHFPDELRGISTAILEHDLTVLGRTALAFASHPRVQRDTEAIVNHVWHLVTGLPWDMMVGVRGLSATAAQAIVHDCPPSDSAETDVVWPMYLRGRGFTLGYVETEGLRFETADRHAHEVEAAGGREAWMAELDADPERWRHRIRYVLQDVEAMLTMTTEPSRTEQSGSR